MASDGAKPTSDPAQPPEQVPDEAEIPASQPVTLEILREIFDDGALTLRRRNAVNLLKAAPWPRPGVLLLGCGKMKTAGCTSFLDPIVANCQSDLWRLPGKLNKRRFQADFTRQLILPLVKTVEHRSTENRGAGNVQNIHRAEALSRGASGQ
jgi:hypothetical protein